MFDGIGTYALLSFGSLFAMLSPFATVPPFLAMTRHNSPEEKLEMARRACLIACSVLAVFSVSGLTILGFFRITVPAFQIAGGLVILRVALEMLQGSRELKVTPPETREGAEKDDISITPLAVPILCGPGTITTGILLAGEARTWAQTVVLLVNVLVIYALTFALFRLATHYSAYLGETALRVTSRLMGLLLLAIAVQFLVDGIRAAAAA